MADSLEIRIGDLRIILLDGIETAATRATASIENYVRQQSLMGVSDEIILQNLNDDLETGRLGLFKQFTGEVRDTITGGLHQATSLGELVEYGNQNGDGADMRWVAVGDDNSCDDCEARNGEIDTLQNWELRGLPASGFSVCQERCRCIIEPVEIPEHGAINLGAAA